MKVRTSELHDYCRRGHLWIEIDAKNFVFRQDRHLDKFVLSACEYCKFNVWIAEEKFQELYKESFLKGMGIDG